MGAEEWLNREEHVLLLQRVECDARTLVPWTTITSASTDIHAHMPTHMHIISKTKLVS